MTLAEELLDLCGAAEATGEAAALTEKVRAYVAREAAREAAWVWAESTLYYDLQQIDARRNYLELRPLGAKFRVPAKGEAASW